LSDLGLDGVVAGFASDLAAGFASLLAAGVAGVAGGADPESPALVDPPSLLGGVDPEER
jgi:hypothetical protein